MVLGCKVLFLVILLALSFLLYLVFSKIHFNDTEVGWQFRKSHVINQASGAGRNYQVHFKVHSSGGTDNLKNLYLNGRCRKDFGDIHFTTSDGVTPLQYWMENCRIIENPTTSSGFFRIKSDGSVYVGCGDTLYKSIARGY